MKAAEARLEEANEQVIDGGTALSALRDVEKLVDNFLRKCPFADEEGERIKKALTMAIQKCVKERAENAADHEWVRSNLGRWSNGSIERWLKKLATDGPDHAVNEDNRRAKERFGALWRQNKKHYFGGK